MQPLKIEAVPNYALSSAQAIAEIRGIFVEHSPQRSDAEILGQIAAIVEEVPKYDVVGFHELADRLRYELRYINRRKDGINSINKLHKLTRVSRSYLQSFRDGQMVCMNIMNRLAAAFGITYVVENYPDINKDSIE